MASLPSSTSVVLLDRDLSQMVDCGGLWVAAFGWSDLKTIGPQEPQIVRGLSDAPGIRPLHPITVSPPPQTTT